MENDIYLKINNSSKMKIAKQLIWLEILRKENIITKEEYSKIKIKITVKN